MASSAEALALGGVYYLFEGVETRRVRSLVDSAEAAADGDRIEDGPPGVCPGVNPFYPPGSLGEHTPIPDFSPQVVPGVAVLHSGSGPHVYMVHGRNGVDVTQVVIAPLLDPCHVCALIYDEEAFRCETVPALAHVLNQRLLREFHRAAPQGEGDEQVPIAISACSLGCPVAHEMALQLQQAGVEVKLVFFALDASWPPMSPWPPSAPALPTGTPERPKGCEWFGGEVETALLAARSSGAVEWAEREVARIESVDKVDADDVLMRIFWEHARHFGMSFASFNDFVSKAGRSSERLRAVLGSYVPAATFSGEVEFVMTRAAWADVPSLFKSND